MQEEFGIKGSVSLEVDRVVSPVTVLSDLCRGGPPPPVRRCSSRIAVGAVVGQVSAFSLRVPPGVAAEITYLYMRTGNAEDFIGIFDAGAGAPGAVQTMGFIDTRALRGTGNVPFCQVVGGNAVAPVIATPTWTEFTTGSATGGEGIKVRNPGWTIGHPKGLAQVPTFAVFSTQTTNALLIATLEWMEWSLSSEPGQ